MAGAKLTGDLTKRMRRGERGAARAVTSTGKLIVKGAKAHVPIDTRHLHDSIRAEPGPDGQVIVTVDTADERHPSYAGYVEFGTRRMAAQPFFIPATEVARKAFILKIRKAYE